jgi:hypothetical protein
MDDAAQDQASHRNMDHGFRGIEALLFNCIEKPRRGRCRWTPLESGGILCGHRSKFVGKVSLCPDKAHN